MNRHDPGAQKKPRGPASPRGKIHDPGARLILSSWERCGQDPQANPASDCPANGSASLSRESITDVVPYHTKASFARRCAWSIRSIDRAAAMGLLPPPDLMLGRSPRWSPETVERWLKSRPRLPGRGRS
jgi:hypothetical protein